MACRRRRAMASGAFDEAVDAALAHELERAPPGREVVVELRLAAGPARRRWPGSKCRDSRVRRTRWPPHRRWRRRGAASRQLRRRRERGQRVFMRITPGERDGNDLSSAAPYRLALYIYRFYTSIKMHRPGHVQELLPGVARCHAVGSCRPPFRADHVGSLLRPKALREAFRAWGGEGPGRRRSSRRRRPPSATWSSCRRSVGSRGRDRRRVPAQLLLGAVCCPL